MNQATIAPVRISLTVPIPADQAFKLFTDGFNSWWTGQHIGRADLAEAVLEPREGGRWYERGVDGSECDWGRVLAFQPPARLVVTWQINSQWEFDPDPAHASEVEVLFAEQDGQTRVDFEHRYIERLGSGADELAGQLNNGWRGILDAYGKAAAAA
jgi:uncharacterized protein YndB with AHSA1/START domain